LETFSHDVIIAQRLSICTHPPLSVHSQVLFMQLSEQVGGVECSKFETSKRIKTHKTPET